MRIINKTKIILQDAFNLQNDFILKIFNDQRIADEVKEEYMNKYNKMQVKITENEVVSTAE